MDTPKEPLAKIPEAAVELGLPAKTLRREAERLGFLVRFGRTLRIARADYPRIIEACRENGQARASSSAETGVGTSATPAACRSAPAREIADRLKRRSRATSPSAAGQLVPLRLGR